MLEELVTSNGQLSSKADAGQHTLTPPSMQAMAQAQVDDLPPALIMVLRCASVMESHCCARMLAMMLPAGVVDSEADLEEMLLTLQDKHLLRMTAIPRNCAANTHARCLWEVMTPPHPSTHPQYALVPSMKQRRHPLFAAQTLRHCMLARPSGLAAIAACACGCLYLCSNRGPHGCEVRLTA